MSEPNPENAEKPERESKLPEGEQAPEGKTFDEAYVKKLREEAAKYRTEAKSGADAVKRLAEIEAANQTETEKVAARLAQAEKNAVDAETTLARFQVALDKGLTPNQAKRLVGTTREELEADAVELLKDLEDAGKPRTPRPDPNQGRPAPTGPTNPRAADLAQIEADLAAPRR